MTTDDSITIKSPTAAAPARGPRRTLGKGLGALLGEAAEDYSQLDSARPATAKAMPIEILSAGPYQPRQNFGTVALEELAESIKEKGIIQPILVRRHPSKPNEFQIIAGERRWRAAQLAGLHEVPVIVREMADSQMAEVALIENVQREDLTILEEAQAYQKLINDFHHTQDAVAKLVGKSRAYIANTLRLLKLPQDVQDKVNEGLITAGHARALLSVGNDPDLYQKLLARNNGGKGMSVREAEAAAQEQRAEKGIKPIKGKLRDANTVALEKMLADTLGLKVSITGRGAKGTLMIRYQNLDQLDDLLRKLCGGTVRI